MSEREPLHITFVCTGNICRSVMAEKMFADQLRR
ncbi:arsenate reductase/protein-tyrosine-phosphatase family protein, partial [Mycobacterium paraintracellulare]